MPEILVMKLTSIPTDIFLVLLFSVLALVVVLLLALVLLFRVLVLLVLTTVVLLKLHQLCARMPRLSL